MSAPVISVVVPVYNEEKNIPELFKRIVKALSDFGRSFEIIFVNDGSVDSTEEILTHIYDQNHHVAVVNLFRKSGKAIALERGFELVRGQYIVIIDADLQHDPEDIPRLIVKLEEGFDVVSGKRMNRNDAPGKVLTSRLFNIFMRMLTGLQIDDYFSGLKVFRFSVIRFLSLYGDLYRFASVFAFKKGCKVAEIPCAHHARAHGNSSYNSIGRVKLAFKDLMTVMFSVTLSRGRVYVLGIFGLLCLSAALTCITIAVYRYGCELFLFHKFYGFLSLCFFFLGGQALILKTVADNFFKKHYDEFCHRQQNVQSVLSVKVE